MGERYELIQNVIVSETGCCGSINLLCREMFPLMLYVEDRTIQKYQAASPFVLMGVRDGSGDVTVNAFIIDAYWITKIDGSKQFL